ncbi:MAG: response regulator transcription factor [Micrococcales bacterium]|nr:response regulator transcription factor [Micrococcales bacterium]
MALVDDYEVVVQGLAAMLRNYRGRVEIAELNANTPVAERVDVVLYDSFANPRGDRDQVRELVANPRVGKVVVYAWDLDDALIATARDNGAAGCISKGLPASRLVAAIESVHRGEQAVHRGPGSAKPVGGDWPGREEGLTERESEILALITQGFSNARVVDHTGLSINSVKTHIRGCYRKIGVATRSQAVLWGVTHGFLPDRVRIRPEAKQH